MTTTARDDMKKIISVILCVSIFFTFSTTSYAIAKESITLDEILTEKIVNLKEKGDRLYLDRNGIEIGLYNNEAGKIRLVDGDNAIEAATLIEEIPEKAFVKRNSVNFNYEKSGIQENVKILKEEYGGEFYDVISDTFLIEKAELNCITKEYKLPGNWGITTSNDMKDSVKFISDSEGNIICSIEDAIAVDKNGKEVKIAEEMIGNNIIYTIKTNPNIVFPVIIELRSHPIKYKVNTLIAKNNATDRANLVAARRMVDERQNNSVNTLISLVNSVFSLFNLATGVIAFFIDSTISMNDAFLEDCEDAYTRGHEDLDDPNCKYISVEHKYKGTWQGKNKEYVYKPYSVTEEQHF